ncbi:MAG: phasin family protein [Gammaproteobacteria bacterium]|nr:phasin family protein [Gammaproteobacteria bacterium]
MTAFNETYEKLAALQKESLEPVRQFHGVAVEAFEQVARKNYAFFGDVLEFAVSQARLTVEITEPKALFDQQLAATKEFAELVTKRATEYVELGKTFQESTTDLIDKDFVEPVRKAAEASAKKAA